MPRVLITMGDAAGIGPEVALKALAGRAVRRACLPALIGDLALLRRVARKAAVGMPLKKIAGWEDVSADSIPVLDAVRLDGRVTPGKPSRPAGRTAAAALRCAVELTGSRDAEGLVTAPVSKESFDLAGYGMVGHTELLAKFTGTRNYAMMLTNDRLRVVFATTHVALARAPGRLTVAGILRKLRLTDAYLLRYMGVGKARIAVAALNPHGGENGRLGSEEIKVIRPAVRRAIDEGILVEGPFPADSIYRPGFARRYDAILAMYHDQGMIPLKLMGHGDVVNITLGIPCLRTSPGHGTAFDIAGTYSASDRSMRMAILECARIAKRLHDAA